MQKTVRIFSTPSCHFCHATKEFFAENNVQYTDHNVAEDQDKRAEMIEKSGQMGVPVILIDDQVVIGYNEKKLRALLGL